MHEDDILLAQCAIRLHAPRLERYVADCRTWRDFRISLMAWCDRGREWALAQALEEEIGKSYVSDQII